MINLLGFFNPTFLGIASLIGQGVGTMMSLRNQRQALAYEQMQARILEKQYKDEADAVSLQMQSEELERKRRYSQKITENRAMMSSTGIDLDRPSYRALFKANQKVIKQDLNKIKLMGTEARLAKLRDAQQAKLTGRAAKTSYQSGVLDTLGRNLLNTAGTLGEFNVLGKDK